MGNTWRRSCWPTEDVVLNLSHKRHEFQGTHREDGGEERLRGREESIGLMCEECKLGRKEKAVQLSYGSLQRSLIMAYDATEAGGVKGVS